MREVKPVGRSYQTPRVTSQVGRAAPKKVGRDTSPASPEDEGMEYPVLADDLEAQVARIDYKLNESMVVVNARLNSEIMTDYYVCVVFQTAEQREAFHKAVGYPRPADEGTYIDGQVLARCLGITLPPGPPEWKKAKVNRVWSELAMEPGQKRTASCPAVPKPREEDD